MTTSRLRGVPGLGVDRMGDAADSAADPELLRLENLDTDLRPHPAALAATHAAIDNDDANSYLPFPGHERLRRAVATHVGRGSREIDWRRTLITAGGLNGILNVLLATLEPGDEVVLTDPVSERLFRLGKVAATPMTNWGSERAADYIRLVFANEPCERLRGVGDRVRTALL